LQWYGISTWVEPDIFFQDIRLQLKLLPGALGNEIS
jgi:hypothetical protein